MSLNLIASLRNWGGSLISSNKSTFSSQAMPNEQSDLITQDFVNATDFIAPSDGYVCLVTENSSNTWYRLSLIDNAINYLFNNNAGAYFGSGWFAVRKGATIKTSLNAGVSASIKFVSTVGGGD